LTRSGSDAAIVATLFHASKTRVGILDAVADQQPLIGDLRRASVTRTETLARGSNLIGHR
jgi:hypothetical protein